MAEGSTRLFVARWVMSTAIIFALMPTLRAQTKADTDDGRTSDRHTTDNCLWQTDNFPLKKQDLAVIGSDGGILFSAGMTIDADGAPNAYGPHNRGLDYTANARGSHGWVALVTNRNGNPIVQKHGPYRGYYVSTTSLQQSGVPDERDPKRYIDANKVPYIALPSDFADRFEINLGDLALVINQANGRSAYAVFADVGPKGRIGEGSIALARQLGIPANPRHDKVEDGITYLVFPGSALQSGRHITARRIKSSAARLYHQWGGTQRLRGCEMVLRSATD
jgi:hypothetical protein